MNGPKMILHTCKSHSEWLSLITCILACNLKSTQIHINPEKIWKKKMSHSNDAKLKLKHSTPHYDPKYFQD